MMPNWICCNSCFHPPAADHRLAVTTCGHIICQKCFQKGKQDECLICKAKCKFSPLSDKSRPEVKALFSDVNVVAHKYLAEIGKVLVFQMRHQKRLLLHYRQKSNKLEGVINKMKQEMQIMNKKMAEQNAYIAKLDTALHQQSLRAAQQTSLMNPLCTSKPTGPLKQIPFASPIVQSQSASASCLVEKMDVDDQGLHRKPEISGSMPRLSLISPPLDGRMGTIQHRSASQSSLVTHSARSAMVSRDKPYERSGYMQRGLTALTLSAPSLSAPTLSAPSLSTPSLSLSYRPVAAWETPSFNPPASFRSSSLSSQSLTLPTLSLQGRLPQ